MQHGELVFPVRHGEIDEAAVLGAPGDCRIAVVDQTAVLPVAGGMVVPLRDDVGRVVPVDGRHGPLDGGGDERAPGAVVMLEDDEIDVLIHRETP